MSTSARPTLRPRARSATARLAATVDLPTPPLPLATAMMRATPSIGGWRETPGADSGMTGHLAFGLDAFGNALGQRAERGGHRTVRIGDDNRRTGVARYAHRACQRDAAEHRDSETIGDPRGAAVAEQMGFFTAARAHVKAHVFDDTEHRNLRLLKHLYAPLHIRERNVLRRRHDDPGVERDLLRKRHLNVAGAGRQIEHEHVELAPGHVAKKLRERLGQHRASPDQRCAVGNEKAHRDQPDAVPDGRDESAVGIAGADAFRTAIACSAPANAEHRRNARSIDVGVEKTDGQPAGCQSDGQIGRDGRFADPALSAGNRDHTSDTWDLRGPAAHRLGRFAGLRGLVDRRSFDDDIDARGAGTACEHAFDIGDDLPDDVLVVAENAESDLDAIRIDDEFLDFIFSHEARRPGASSSLLLVSNGEEICNARGNVKGCRSLADVKRSGGRAQRVVHGCLEGVLLTILTYPQDWG